eukprot:2007863-Amphidinium_carterae.1
MVPHRLCTTSTLIRAFPQRGFLPSEVCTSSSGCQEIDSNLVSGTSLKPKMKEALGRLRNTDKLKGLGARGWLS